LLIEDDSATQIVVRISRTISPGYGPTPAIGYWLLRGHRRNRDITRYHPVVA
jgi:hypothetical protein